MNRLEGPLRCAMQTSMSFMALTLLGCDESPVQFEFDESGPIVCASDARLGVPSAGDLYHGVYPGGRSGEEDDITVADLVEYERSVDRTAAWVYFSHNWYRSRAFPRETAGWIRDQGAVPFIRLMLRSTPEQYVQESVFTLEAIIAGDFDDDLEAWGREVAAFGTPVLVEWGTEANGEWFPWNGVWNGGPSQGPALFRGAYRHIVRTVCSQGASNVSWAFHANDTDVPDASWNALERYYPGDDAVDWLGVSVYGALTPTDADWPNFSDDLDAVMGRIDAVGGGKPVFVLEFGATTGNPGGDASAWADAALTDLLAGRWPSVRGFSWWNEQWRNDEDRTNDTNMRVQDIPGAREVFRGHLASPFVIDRPILRGAPPR
jgi:glycosyl hydrolase family 26